MNKYIEKVAELLEVEALEKEAGRITKRKKETIGRHMANAGKGTHNLLSEVSHRVGNVVKTTASTATRMPRMHRNLAIGGGVLGLGALGGAAAYNHFKKD